MSFRNILEVRNLSVSFGDSESRYEVVSDVSLDIPRGKIICVVGESGCGKTVMALSIMGLLPVPPGKVESGEIIFDGNDLLELPEKKLRGYRGNRLSMIFQEPVNSFNPVFTVGEQIGEVLRIHRNLSRSEEREKVINLMKTVGIPAPEARVNSYPHELSGGMCQRAMIAMALACDPELLIADEPTTALDVTIQAEILRLLLHLRDITGMAVLLITHDLGIVSEVADEVYVVYAGKVVEKGTRDLVFNSPSHPYTKGLIKSIPSLDKKVEDLPSIPGYVPSPKNLPSSCRFQDRCEYVIDKCRNQDPDLKKVNPLHFSACHRSEEILKQ